MIFWHLVLLAFIQGITDPLPISSSGHLALFHHFLDADVNSTQGAAQARAIDIAVHIGTLFSLLVYFWGEVKQLFIGTFDMARGRLSTQDSRLLQYLFVASVPAVIAGFFLSQQDPSVFYDLERLAILSIVFGVVLYVSDRVGKDTQTVADMNFKNALLFGLAQVLSLVPGVSRSGITMTAGRFLGFGRVEAARFSLLMAIIVTAGAGALGTYDIIKDGGFALNGDFVWGIILSFFSSYAALALMMRWLKNYSFTPFVVYRLIFGVVVLAASYYGFLA